MATGQGEIASSLKRINSGWIEGKSLLLVRVERHWNGLPRDMVDASFLETFKVRLDQALSNLM